MIFKLIINNQNMMSLKNFIIFLHFPWGILGSRMQLRPVQIPCDSAESARLEADQITKTIDKIMLFTKATYNGGK